MSQKKQAPQNSCLSGNPFNCQLNYPDINIKPAWRLSPADKFSLNSDHLKTMVSEVISFYFEGFSA